QNLLRQDGLFGQPAGSPAGTEQRIDLTALTATIQPIRAQAGSIDVRAGSLTGTGIFVAPGDASVTITNKTPVVIKLLGIVIPENTGGVFLNGDEQVAGGAVQDPSIVVENTLDVTLSSVTENGAVKYAWPGITVLGSIENLNGKLTLQVV